MDFSSKSPKKEFNKDITSKIETPKHNDNNLKIPIDKPDKPRNKIERSKIDINKEPRNKIQREKIDLSIPPRNKIESPKFDLKARTRNKIEPRKIDPNQESKHKLQPRLIDPKAPPRHKLQPRIIDPKTIPKCKIDPPQKKPNMEPRQYNNLLNPKIQSIFKKYYQNTKKHPNYGRRLTKDFIKWVEENNPEIKEKVNDIQFNQEIKNFIEDKIINTFKTQNSIKRLIEDIGVHASLGTIKKISLENVFNNDLDKYEKRFSSNKYKRLPASKKTSIEQRIRTELEKENPDSLYKISKEFSNVSNTTIIKLAKEIINPELFHKTWPPSFKEIPNDIKLQIAKTLGNEMKKDTPRSLKKISDECLVSEVHIQNVAKSLFPDQYHLKWPAVQKIPSEVKQNIIHNIKNEIQKENPCTLTEIHKNFPSVSMDTIQKLAKNVVPKEIYNKIWPPLLIRIPEHIRIQVEKSLKEEIKRDHPSSLSKIAKEFNVSREYVRRTAIKIFPQSIYSKKWEPSLKILSEVKKKEIYRYILNTNLNLHEISEKCGVSRKTISRISRTDVYQDNLNAHQNRFPKDLDMEIGTFTHKNINSVITEVISRNSSSRYYSEPKMFPDLRCSDGIIPEYNQFLGERLKTPIKGKYLAETLGISPKNISKIKATQFDFTNDLCEENIINKIEKYQSPKTLFFIIGTKWNSYNDVKELPKNDLIKYPENIRVISHDLFADLIGISGKDRELFNRIIDFNNNKDLEALKTLYNFDLSSINTYNRNHLKEDLIQKGLMKKKFSEYFNFAALKTKNDKERQLELSYFLNG